MNIETGSDARTYFIHPHPDFTQWNLEGHYDCIFCMMPGKEDTPATHFVQDDRGWLMPYCDAHYQDMMNS